MIQKILKNGNSLAVTIPARFVRVLGLKPGSIVKADVDITNGKITYFFSSANQLTLLNK